MIKKVINNELIYEFAEVLEAAADWLSPSIHIFDDVFIHSGLSAACDELSRDE